MLKLFKRVSALTLVLVMALSAVACGGNGGTVDVNNDGGSSGPIDISANIFDTDSFIASMPAELKGTKMQFYNWYDPMEREEGAVITAFEAASGIDVEIILATYGPQYTETLAAKLATGDAPDVMRMEAPKPAYMKALQPVTNSGYDFSDPAWNKPSMDAYSVNGKCYGVNLTYTTFFGPSIFFYNTDTMEEMGYDDPWELWKKGEWTWDKLNEMCADWVKQGPEYNGLYQMVFGLAGLNAGKDFVTYDGSKYSTNLTDPDLLDCWRFITEGVKANRFGSKEQSKFDSANQTVLFALQDATSVQNSSRYFPKSKRRGSLGAAPPPKWKDADYYVGIAEELAFGIPKDAKNAAAVPYFLSWYLNMAKFDTEGTNFFFSEQAKEVYLELAAQPRRAFYTSQYIFEEMDDFNWDLYYNCEPSQLTTVIQSKEYLCADSVIQMNEILANMAQ